MDSELWRQVEGIFDHALDLAVEDRKAYLDEACGGNSEIRQEVEALLVADVVAQEKVEQALEGGFALLSDTKVDARTGTEPMSKIDTESTHILKRFGKYQIFEMIGEGGFGKVFRGLDPVLQREVAIKTCNLKEKDVRERFFREARISARLQHPNVVTVHDFGQEEEKAFLVQEFLQGKDLSDLIAEERPQELATRLQVLIQVARGMTYAHDKGVLHRDIKPANILVQDSGDAKILDFGIARLLDEQHRLTSQRLTLGTVGYLAPEVLKTSEADARSDIFSFGVVAYELSCFARPFTGDSFTQIAWSMVHDDPEPLAQRAPDIPKHLARLITRCLEKEPERRPQSFAEIVDELEAIAMAPGEPEDSLEESKPPAKRLWVAGVLAAILASSLGGAWYFSQDHSQDHSQNLPQGSEPPSDLSPTLEAQVDPSSSIAVETIEPELGGTTESSQPPASQGEPPPSTLADRDTARTRSASPPQEDPKPASRRSARKGPEKETETATLETLVDDKAPGLPGVNPISTPEISTPETSTLETEIAGDIGTNAPPVVDPTDATTGSGAAENTALPPPPATSAAQLLNKPVPKYPPTALRQRKEARVVVAVYVGADGAVQRTLVSQSNGSGLGFDEAAREAADQARFDPALDAGRPVAAWSELIFDFVLP